MHFIDRELVCHSALDCPNARDEMIRPLSKEGLVGTRVPTEKKIKEKQTEQKIW